MFHYAFSISMPSIDIKVHPQLAVISANEYFSALTSNMKCIFVIGFLAAAVVVYAEPPRAPYAPSGWKPSGQQFRLPERQQKVSQKYGPPITTESDITTTELPRRQRVSPVKHNQRNQQEQEIKEDVPTEKGVYYVYHPNGMLQKVEYTTKNDEKNMAYFAQLKYENVDPIKEPIYTYDPETLELKRVQV